MTRTRYVYVFVSVMMLCVGAFRSVKALRSDLIRFDRYERNQAMNQSRLIGEAIGACICVGLAAAQGFSRGRAGLLVGAYGFGFVCFLSYLPFLNQLLFAWLSSTTGRVVAPPGFSTWLVFRTCLVNSILTVFGVLSYVAAKRTETV